MDPERRDALDALHKPRGEMTRLSDDKDHYAKCWQTYLSLTDRNNALEAFLENTFQKTVVEKLDVVDSRNQSFTLKSLGVGCGLGVIDRTIMNQLSHRFPRISHTVLEPYDDSIEGYRALVKREPIPAVTRWDWRRQTWEQFQEQTRREGKSSEKYHFIGAMSVVYYLHSWKDSILDMYGHLEKGGILVIHLVAGEAGYQQAGKYIPALFDDRFSTMTSHTIKDFLVSEDIPFTCSRHDHYVDICCCFEENHETGTLILDFLSHVKDLENSSPKELSEDFRAYLKTPGCSRQDGDAVMLNISTESIIVKKELNGA